MILNVGTEIVYQGKKAKVVAMDFGWEPVIQLKIKTGWFSSDTKWVPLASLMTLL